MLRIALTASPGQDPGATLIKPSYIDFVLLGGRLAGEDVCPVVLPLVDPAEQPGLIPRYADAFDGFLFTGGGDIDPGRYGKEVHPLCGAWNKRRDDFELALLEALIARKKPVFGICRGIQVMNVALGGTLWQDINAEINTGRPPHLAPGEQRHAVRCSGALEALLGCADITVNSLHHQAIRDPGEGAELCAVSPDGVPEAMICRSLPFYCAVQWHPERIPEDDASRKLAAAFIRASKDAKSN